MRWRKSCMLATRRDKQPRAKRLISISAIFNQLPWMPCGMELDSLQDAPRLGGREGFIQGSGRMRVQIILDKANGLRTRIDFIDHPLDTMCVVDLRPVVRYFDMAPAGKRFNEEKQIGGAQALILLINPLWLARLHCRGLPHVRLGCDQFFVEAHRGITRVVLLFVHIQDIFHRRDELGTYGWQTPLVVLPGLKFVFLSNWRMVSCEMDSTKPNSTAFPATKRTVQWSWPVGTGLHAMAIRWAACPPVNAWRYRCCRLSCSTASTPPSRYTCRTRMEVLRLTSKAAQMCWSVQPSSAVSKMRARVKVRAVALPAWMNVCSDARSLSDSVTGMGCFLEVLLLSHDHLTPVNIILD